MRKSEELSNPNSCLNRAREDEFVFTLLGRDPAAPAAIRAWAHERVRIGKNKPDDDQIVNALALAGRMEDEHTMLGLLSAEADPNERTYTTEQSSNVAGIKYDADASTMDVLFHNGGSYRYFDVPRETFDSAVSAPSIGRYLNQSIKGAFRHEQLLG